MDADDFSNYKKLPWNKGNRGRPQNKDKSKHITLNVKEKTNEVLSNSENKSQFVDKSIEYIKKREPDSAVKVLDDHINDMELDKQSFELNGDKQNADELKSIIEKIRTAPWYIALGKSRGGTTSGMSVLILFLLMMMVSTIVFAILFQNGCNTDEITNCIEIIDPTLNYISDRIQNMFYKIGF